MAPIRESSRILYFWVKRKMFWDCFGICPTLLPIQPGSLIFVTGWILPWLASVGHRIIWHSFILAETTSGRHITGVGSVRICAIRICSIRIRPIWICCIRICRVLICPIWICCIRIYSVWIRSVWNCSVWVAVLGQNTGHFLSWKGLHLTRLKLARGREG